MSASANKRLMQCLCRKRGRGERTPEELYNDIQTFLEQGADPNHQSRGTIPLCEASRAGREDIVNLLLRNQANVNLSDKNQCSPLYLAASHGHLNVAKILIENGADINAKTKHGYLPLLSAVENSHLDVSRLLIETGADVNISRPNTFGIEMSLLTFVLFAKSDFQFAECLLQAGVNPHPFEKPLNFILLEYGDECRDFVKRLVYAGFDFYCEGWIKLTRNKIVAQLAEVSENEQEMLDFLEFEHKNVPNLQRLCRTVVRYSLSMSPLRVHLKTKISQLPLPTEVKRFLSLDYIC